MKLWDERSETLQERLPELTEVRWVLHHAKVLKRSIAIAVDRIRYPLFPRRHRPHLTSFVAEYEFTITSNNLHKLIDGLLCASDNWMASLTSDGTRLKLFVLSLEGLELPRCETNIGTRLTLPPNSSKQCSQRYRILRDISKCPFATDHPWAMEFESGFDQSPGPFSRSLSASNYLPAFPQYRGWFATGPLIWPLFLQLSTVRISRASCNTMLSPKPLVLPMSRFD